MRRNRLFEEQEEFNDIIDTLEQQEQTEPIDPFENLTKEEVLKHYGIEEETPQDKKKKEEEQKELLKKKQEEERKKRVGLKKKQPTKKTSKTTSTKGSKRVSRTPRKVYLPISPLNWCKNLLPLKRVDMESLLEVYGEDFYIVSLFNPQQSPGYNMSRTLNFLTYLKQKDYGYIPIYDYDKKSKRITNIFLMIFNYKMTPSYETEVMGRRKVRSFYKDIHYILSLFGIDLYILNTPTEIYVSEGDYNIHFVDEYVSLEYVIRYYTKKIGLSPRDLLCVNDVPDNIEYDYRTVNKEICLDYDVLS